MRRFSSYGPINIRQHYYAPREELIDKTYLTLVGEDPKEGGHYITVWAPRQTGKTWVMRETIQKIKKSDQFEAALLSLESVKREKDEKAVVRKLISKLTEAFQIDFPALEQVAFGKLAAAQCDFALE